jgi:hypothetical protein
MGCFASAHMKTKKKGLASRLEWRRGFLGLLNLDPLGMLTTSASDHGRRPGLVAEMWSATPLPPGSVLPNDGSRRSPGFSRLHGQGVIRLLGPRPAITSRGHYD